MIFDKLQAIVLAAGKSTRFKTGNTKLLEKLCGQEMIVYQTKLLSSLTIKTTVVVGYQKEAIQNVINTAHNHTISFATQEEQKGTGHALLCTAEQWDKEHILIMNGDMPLIPEEVIRTLCDAHLESNAAISFIKSHLDDTKHSYGRVVTNDGITRIIEAKNFTLDPHEHCWINAGIYIIKTSFLRASISELKKDAISQEFYITDLVEIASLKGDAITTVSVPFDQVRGINTLQELWATEHIKRSEIIRQWMERGVRFEAAHNAYIDLHVVIEAGTFIGAGVHISGYSVIGNNCILHHGSTINASTIGSNTTIHPYSVISDSTIQENAFIGPFAHIREHAEIGNDVTIGNFVEVKQSTIGDKTKAKHLSYLGNAEIGNHVNIGAGTITCNHNGVSKHKTTIEDYAYIGSNNTLIAPIIIGEGAFTAAGSVITHNVPSSALAIGRSRQVNKEGYANELLNKNYRKSSEHHNDIFFSGAFKTAAIQDTDELL